MDKMGNSFIAGLDSVNRSGLEAERLQEDLAMGGSTNSFLHILVLSGVH